MPAGAGAPAAGSVFRDLAAQPKGREPSGPPREVAPCRMNAHRAGPLNAPVHRTSTILYATVATYEARHEGFYEDVTYGLYGNGDDFRVCGGRRGTRREAQVRRDLAGHRRDRTRTHGACQSARSRAHRGHGLWRHTPRSVSAPLRCRRVLFRSRRRRAIPGALAPKHSGGVSGIAGLAYVRNNRCAEDYHAGACGRRSR